MDSGLSNRPTCRSSQESRPSNRPTCMGSQESDHGLHNEQYRATYTIRSKEQRDIMTSFCSKDLQEILL